MSRLPRLSPMVLAGVLLIAAGLLGGCLGVPRGAEPTTVGEGPPIGIYDSRAVAVASADYGPFGEWLGDLRARAEEAKAAGNEERLRELEAEALAEQDKLHRQGFGTAPIDDILGWIEEKLPAIREEAGVEALVSKWDEKGLAQWPDSPRIDVTERLIDAFNPSAERREMALSVLEHDPLPAWRLKMMGPRD